MVAFSGGLLFEDPIGLLLLQSFTQNAFHELAMLATQSPAQISALRLLAFDVLFVLKEFFPGGTAAIERLFHFNYERMFFLQSKGCYNNLGMKL